MVKLIYNGAKAKGLFVTSGGYKLSVEKGESYDIPTRLVDKFLASGEWKKQYERKVVEKPKKEDKQEYEEEHD